MHRCPLAPSRLRPFLSLIVVSGALVIAKPSLLRADPVLIVVGLEYTTPIHFGVAGVTRSLDAFSYQSASVPPYDAVAADLVALRNQGNQPLTWYAHPNWRPSERTPSAQRDDLLGIQAASGGQWHPDAIGLLNVGIDPTFGDPPANWRKQLAIELANLYCPVVAPDSLPAFFLEVDFHAPPTLFFDECGSPSTIVWVPDNWRALSPLAAKDSVFAAVRARQVIGSSGPARFLSLESDSSGMSLELTEPIQHLELWGGGAQPVATWSNSASATIAYSQLSGAEPYLYWFAYGDTLGGGNGGWNTWSCRDKQIFFTSPMPRTGPTSFANPYSAAARSGRMPIEVLVHQHSSISYDAPNAPTFTQLMDQCRSLGIDCVLTTDHDPTLTGQLPSFVAAWDSIPPSTPGSITSSGSGPWSSTIPDAPWPSGNVPTLNDQVTIRDGTTVTIDVNASCRSLTVGEGTSGVLEFEAANARTLSVSGDVTIASGGELRSAASGSVTAHELRVTGNLTNNGTLDLSTNGDAAGARLVFTGPASATFGGSGAVTDLSSLKVHKGVSYSPVVTLAPSTLTIRGGTNDAQGFLILVSGTLRIAGAFSLSSVVFVGSASYVIGPTAGLWLDNPNFVVLGNDGSPRNGGLLRLSQGTLRVGTHPENVLSANSGGVFDFQGGTVEVAGRFGTSNAVTYTQSGGTVHVATMGNLSSNAGSFDLSSPGSTFAMSGGTIVLVKPSTGAVPLDFRVSAQNLNVTGGTVRVGDAATPPGSLFYIAGSLPSLFVRGSPVRAIARLYAASPATRAFTGTTIEAGAKLELNGFSFLETGAVLTNQGTIDGTVTGSQLVFSGMAPQSYGGAGSVHVYGLTVDNPGGVTVGGDGMTVTSSLNLTHGLVHTSGSGPLVLASTVASLPAGSSTSYIDGPLSIERSCSSPIDVIFAVGREGAFRPILLRSLNTGGVAHIFVGEVLPGAPGGTPDPPLIQLAGSRRFRLGGSDFLNSGAAIQLTFGSGDGVIAVEAARVAQASTANGVYGNRGGTGSGTPDSGTVESTLSLVPGQDYFAVGLVAEQPVLWIGDAAVTEGDSAAVDARFTVYLSGTISQTVTVNWQTADGTATAASGDYTAVSTPQTIVFNPGGPFTHEVAVSIHGDVITETDETFRVDLSGAQGANILDATGIGTIVNDDALPALAVGDVSVAEGDSGTVAAVFPVTLSRPSQPRVRVLWSTADGTATAASGDYFAVAPPETLTFELGNPLSTSVTVAVAGDQSAEADETFFVLLSQAENATIARGRGQGTIVNDDIVLDASPVAPPVETFLGLGSPNPFSQQTALPFGLRAAGRVNVEVFDANGRFVRNLVQGTLPAGETRLVWDGRDRWGRPVASGMYLLRLDADGKIWTRRLLVVR